MSVTVATSIIYHKCWCRHIKGFRIRQLRQLRVLRRSSGSNAWAVPHEPCYLCTICLQERHQREARHSRRAPHGSKLPSRSNEQQQTQHHVCISTQQQRAHAWGERHGQRSGHVESRHGCTPYTTNAVVRWSWVAGAPAYSKHARSTTRSPWPAHTPDALLTGTPPAATLASSVSPTVGW